MLKYSLIPSISSSRKGNPTNQLSDSAFNLVAAPRTKDLLRYDTSSFRVIPKVSEPSAKRNVRIHHTISNAKYETKKQTGVERASYSFGGHKTKVPKLLTDSLPNRFLKVKVGDETEKQDNKDRLLGNDYPAYDEKIKINYRLPALSTLSKTTSYEDEQKTKTKKVQENAVQLKLHREHLQNQHAAKIIDQTNFVRNDMVKGIHGKKKAHGQNQDKVTLSYTKNDYGMSVDKMKKENDIEDFVIDLVQMCNSPSPYENTSGQKSKGVSVKGGQIGNSNRCNAAVKMEPGYTSSRASGTEYAVATSETYQHEVNETAASDAEILLKVPRLVGLRCGHLSDNASIYSGDTTESPSMYYSDDNIQWHKEYLKYARRKRRFMGYGGKQLIKHGHLTRNNLAEISSLPLIQTERTPHTDHFVDIDPRVRRSHNLKPIFKRNPNQQNMRNISLRKESDTEYFWDSETDEENGDLFPGLMKAPVSLNSPMKKKLTPIYSPFMKKLKKKREEERRRNEARKRMQAFVEKRSDTMVLVPPSSPHTMEISHNFIYINHMPESCEENDLTEDDSGGTRQRNQIEDNNTSPLINGTEDYGTRASQVDSPRSNISYERESNDQDNFYKDEKPDLTSEVEKRTPDTMDSGTYVADNETAASPDEQDSANGGILRSAQIQIRIQNKKVESKAASGRQPHVLRGKGNSNQNNNTHSYGKLRHQDNIQQRNEESPSFTPDSSGCECL